MISHTEMELNPNITLNPRIHTEKETLVSSAHSPEKPQDNLTSPLSLAVRAGKSSTIISLLNGGADVNAVDENGLTALHNAVLFSYKKLDIIGLLLCFHADPELQDNLNQSALQLAIRKNIGHEAIKLLLESGADPNHRDQKGRTPLVSAVALTPHESEQIVRLLLHYDADPYNGDKNYKLPVQWAAKKDESRGVVKVFVEYDLVSNTGFDKDGKTALFYAAQIGASGIFEASRKKRRVYNLRSMNDYGTIDKFGRNALHYAAMCNWETRYLVGHNIDSDRKDHVGMAPLHYAAYWFNNRALSGLLEADADVNTRDHTGKTPLHYAARHASAEPMIESLLRAGADINAADYMGETPLHCAAQHADAISCLAQAGARINMLNKSNKSALHYAVLYNNTKAVSQLLLLHPDVNLQDNDGRTALHEAACAGATDVVSQLISHQAQLNIIDGSQRTALHEAARAGSCDTISVFLRSGADIGSRGSQGWTALHETAKADSMESISLILESGGDIEAVGQEGETSLHVAAGAGSHQVILALMQRGANIAATDSTGKTALHYAVVQPVHSAVKLLLDHGADINARDNFGITAFCHAMFSGPSMNARELYRRGADKNGLVEASKVYSNTFPAADMSPLSYDWVQQMLSPGMFSGNGHDVPSVSIIQWGIPNVVRSFNRTNTALTQPKSGQLAVQAIARLRNALTFSGSSGLYEANTLLNSVGELYGDIGLLALELIESALQNFGQLVERAWPNRTMRFLATETHLIVCKLYSSKNKAEEQKVDAALLWICQSLRLRDQNTIKGMWISPPHEKILPGEFLNIYNLAPFRPFDTEILTEGNGWMRLIPSGFFAERKIQRPWGKGLKASTNLMANIAHMDLVTQLVDRKTIPNKEGYCMNSKEYVLIPVARRRNPKIPGVQWRLIVRPNKHKPFKAEFVQHLEWSSTPSAGMLEKAECYLE